MDPVNRRALLTGAGATLAQGCASVRPFRSSGRSEASPRLKIDRKELIKVTVCTRPFRPAGPRLERDQIGDKAVVHNYGHGGSGWSLSWGCAEDAAQLALATGAIRFAVIGAGVMGLTTALRLIETGAGVTIYAEAFPAETRSARATGVWSPSSRIGLGDAVPAGFEDRWERWARSSYATHQRFLGLVGDPVEYQPTYSVRDAMRAPRPAASRDFLHLDRRLGGLTPTWSDIDRADHPFAKEKSIRGGLGMVFTVATYAQHLTREFLVRGGKMVRRQFPDRSAVLALSEPTILNCTGYGAKALWGAEDLDPVRGQINWLAPQPQARYGYFHGDVYVVSRRDGVVVQYTGDNDDYGYGDASETPDAEETNRALTLAAAVFS